MIDSEPTDAIHVGAGGRLIVPREDLSAELDAGDEMDLASALAKKSRRPASLRSATPHWHRWAAET